MSSGNNPLSRWYSRVDQSNQEQNEKDIREEVSLGSLMKRAREERHIDLDEAFRVTRIRRHTLEALENEQWDKLPSQVFVRGFLKTYAEFLGLDKEIVLSHYQKISPFDKDKSDTLKQVRPRARRRYLGIIISLLALAFIASIMYLNIRDIPVVEKTSQYPGTQPPVEKEEGAIEEEGGIEQGGREIAQGSFRDEEGLEEEQAAPPPPTSIEETEIGADVTGEEEAADKPPPPTSIEEAEVEGDVTAEEETEEKQPPPRFILTANVKKRTWIAIYVDEQPLKEYLFQPGQRFRWTAEKGFDILIGNAGGIDFFLNDREIGNLGAEGQVLRLRLPEGSSETSDKALERDVEDNG
jgi:cytoskeleton protein RodZ